MKAIGTSRFPRYLQPNMNMRMLKNPLGVPKKPKRVPTGFPKHAKT